MTIEQCHAAGPSPLREANIEQPLSTSHRSPTGSAGTVTARKVDAGDLSLLNATDATKPSQTRQCPDARAQHADHQIASKLREPHRPRRRRGDGVPRGSGWVGATRARRERVGPAGGAQYHAGPTSSSDELASKPLSIPSSSCSAASTEAGAGGAYAPAND